MSLSLNQNLQFFLHVQSFEKKLGCRRQTERCT